jgi:WD repeat-containing protein 19
LNRTFVGRQHNEAQTLFLASSRPITALEMRRDLLQWEAALRLAKTLAPAQVPAICRQYAQQLEFKAEYSQAAQYYQKALSEDAALLNQAVNAATASGAFQSAPGVFVDSTGASVQLGYESDADTINSCRHGIARMMLRLGDLVKGKELALATQNSALIKECAFILDSMKQYGEAAELFVAAQLFERAAAIYIATKNFKAAAPLMKRITAPKLHSQFAKAKETEGAFVEAADSYEAAKDMDSVVRLLLGPLQNPQKAFAIVRRTRSAEGAALVASFCAHIGDVPAGIEFLLLAKRNEDAFKLAQAHDAMAVC